LNEKKASRNEVKDFRIGEANDKMRKRKDSITYQFTQRINFSC